jgi:Domain of unknown function (DUF4403)
VWFPLARHSWQIRIGFGLKGRGGMRRIAAIAVLLVIAFFGALWIMDWIWPRVSAGGPPALAEVPPLEAVTRSSTIVVPVAIADTAIRDALEAQAPHELSGKKDNPVAQLLSNADIGWTVRRGPLAVSGRSDALVVSTALNGTMHITGQLSEAAGNLTGMLGAQSSRQTGGSTPT